MHARMFWIVFFSTLFCGSLFAQGAKSTPDAKSTGTNAAPSPPPAASTPSPAPATPPTAPVSPTLTELQQDLHMATIVISVLIVVAACIVWAGLAGRISKAASGIPAGATLAQVHTEVAPLATREGVQNAVAPLASLERLQNAIAPLATAIQQQTLATGLETLRGEMARLTQDVAVVKGSNDSVLNLVSHMVPGLPPQISSLEPVSARAGARVVLWGNNFPAGCSVWFGTTAAQPVDATDNMIRVLVPPGITGELNVYVQGHNGVSAPRRFTITS